jgi:hypothetical protein
VRASRHWPLAGNDKGGRKDWVRFVDFDEADFILAWKRMRGPPPRIAANLASSSSTPGPFWRDESEVRSMAECDRRACTGLIRDRGRSAGQDGEFRGEADSRPKAKVRRRRSGGLCFSDTATQIRRSAPRRLCVVDKPASRARRSPGTSSPKRRVRGQRLPRWLPQG